MTVIKIYITGLFSIGNRRAAGQTAKGVYYHYVRVEPRFPIKYLSKRKNRTQNFHSQIFASARFARSGPRFARLRQQNFEGGRKMCGKFFNVNFFSYGKGVVKNSADESSRDLAFDIASIPLQPDFRS